MQDVTVSEDNNHLEMSVQGGQQTYQSLKVTSRTNLATKGMRNYQIKDKNERKQIYGRTVTPALNAAQLTLWPHYCGGDA